jgi:hypothetical protein
MLKSYSSPEAFFPKTLASLPVEDLARLSEELQEQVFRECNSRAGWARRETLMRQALVDLELAFRQENDGPNGELFFPLRRRSR